MEDSLKKPPDVIDWISKIGVLATKPGDVIVLRTLHPIPMKTRDDMRAVFLREFPKNQVILLEGGIDIGVISKG